MTPEPHPEPPVNLSERPLPIVFSSGPWFRIHKKHYSPLYFGIEGYNRFTGPNKQYRMLYMGHDEHCCFIETFGQSTGINTITTRELNQNSISCIETNRPLSLVDLTGSGLAQIGADGRLTTEVPHDVARRWALALWQHPSVPDGIYYRARHDLSRFSTALYNRAENVVHATLVADLSSSSYAKKLSDILDTYKFGLIVDS